MADGHEVLAPSGKRDAEWVSAAGRRVVELDDARDVELRRGGDELGGDAGE